MDDDCYLTKQARPRWATIHPDNWTNLEVKEWVSSVVEEYQLSPEVRANLQDAFFTVSGRDLSAMTLREFTDLDPQYGPFLFTVFKQVYSTGKLRLAEHPDNQPRTLTPIIELEFHVNCGSRDHLHSEDDTNQQDVSHRLPEESLQRPSGRKTLSEDDNTSRD